MMSSTKLFCHGKNEVRISKIFQLNITWRTFFHATQYCTRRMRNFYYHGMPYWIPRKKFIPKLSAWWRASVELFKVYHFILYCDKIVAVQRKNVIQSVYANQFESLSSVIEKTESEPFLWTMSNERGKVIEFLRNASNLNIILCNRDCFIAGQKTSKINIPETSPWMNSIFKAFIHWADVVSFLMITGFRNSQLVCIMRIPLNYFPFVGRSFSSIETIHLERTNT